MKTHYHIIIAGAGGIAAAAALMLAELSPVTPSIYIGNRTLEKAEKVSEWVRAGTTRSCNIMAFPLTLDLNPAMKEIFGKADLLLDCLPGNLAPKMASLAKEFQIHYANLTEYVSETEEIIAIAKDATTGFYYKQVWHPDISTSSVTNFLSNFVWISVLQMQTSWK